MRRLNMNEIVLTNQELEDIRYFIESTLDREWDQHTNKFICTDSLADGMRRMNPEMYDLAEKIGSI